MSTVSFTRASGILVFSLTITLSVMMLHSPGTEDVATWRDWMNTVYQDGLVHGYSKVILSAGGDYPPISFAILYLARILGDTVALPPLDIIKVLVLVFQLLSAGIVLLISRDFWIAAAVNGSILLYGVCLGYLDVCVAPWLILAFWAFGSRRDMLGTVSFLLACLIKWQPLIVAPFIAIHLFQISDLRSLRAALGGLLFRKLIIVIGVVFGLLFLVFGITPLLSLRAAMGHRYLSGNALNLPWIAGCLVMLVRHPSFLIRTDEFPIIVAPSSLYLLPFKMTFFTLFGTLLLHAMRSEKTYVNLLLFSLSGFMTYVMFNAGVHENHWFVAVILAFLLISHCRTQEHWAIVAMIAVMANLNLFIFYGVTGTTVQSRVVGVDLSIILAILYAVAWVLVVAYTWRVSPLSRWQG